MDGYLAKKRKRKRKRREQLEVDFLSSLFLISLAG
jgi:hypothetical protein